MKKAFICFLIAVSLVVCSPVLSLAAHLSHPQTATTAVAQTAGEDEVCAQAKADATVDNSGMKWVWFGAGCLLGFIGIIGGFFIPMAVPNNRVMGKSSAYVEEYTRCYQEFTKNENGMMAVWGCVTECVCSIIFYVVYVVVLGAALFGMSSGG